MKKLSKDQFQTLMNLKLGFENHLQDISEVKFDSSDKKFNKSVEKLIDKAMNNIKSYNVLVDKLTKDYEVPGYIYIDLGENAAKEEIVVTKEEPEVIEIQKVVGSSVYKA